MDLPYADSTQNFLDIIDIKDDTLILRGPRFCIVLESSALNFDLLAEKEQDAAIFAYANFVNSLNYPIQVVIRTRQINIGDYLKYLEEQEKLQPSEALREQMQAYIKFVRQLVLESTILYKRFFVIIPYRQIAISRPGLLDTLFSFFPFTKKSEPRPTYKTESFDKAKEIFNEREQEITWHFRRLGIEVNRLTTPELVKLFFEIYNPETETKQTLGEDAEGFFTPFVKASVS